MELERRNNGKREHEQRKECKGGNSGNIGNSGNSGKRKYDEGAKVGVEGRGCGHVLDHRIMLLCPGWVGALGITMVDTVLWVLPWTRVGTVNIPWIDTGTKVVREVEHGGRFINISSTAHWAVPRELLKVFQPGVPWKRNAGGQFLKSFKSSIF